METTVTGSAAALVAATWLLVRAVRPYLDAVIRFVGGSKPPADGQPAPTIVDGQGVFLLVLAAAFAVTMADALATGSGLTAAVVPTALATAVAAVGADQLVKNTGRG